MTINKLIREEISRIALNEDHNDFTHVDSGSLEDLSHHDPQGEIIPLHNHRVKSEIKKFGTIAPGEDEHYVFHHHPSGAEIGLYHHKGNLRVRAFEKKHDRHAAALANHLGGSNSRGD